MPSLSEQTHKFGDVADRLRVGNDLIVVRRCSHILSILYNATSLKQLVFVLIKFRAQRKQGVYRTHLLLQGKNNTVNKRAAESTVCLISYRASVLSGTSSMLAQLCTTSN